MPPEEWWKLDGTEAGTVWRSFDPRMVQVVVVERDGQLVGCHVLLPVLHAECLWVHPDFRRASVLRVLWGEMKRLVRAWGCPAVMTAAMDDRVRRLLRYVGGQKIEADFYVVPVKE